MLYSLLYIRHHILPFCAYSSWQYFPFSTSVSQPEKISIPSASCGVFMDHCFQRLICFKVTMSNFPIYTHKHFILNHHGQKRQVYFCFWRQRPLVQDLESRENLELLSKGGMGRKYLLANHFTIPSGLTVKSVLSLRLLMINSMSSPDHGSTFLLDPQKNYIPLKTPYLEIKNLHH